MLRERTCCLGDGREGDMGSTLPSAALPQLEPSYLQRDREPNIESWACQAPPRPLREQRSSWLATLIVQQGGWQVSAAYWKGMDPETVKIFENVFSSWR